MGAFKVNERDLSPPDFTLAARSMSYLAVEPTEDQVKQHAEYASKWRRLGFEFKYCHANGLYARPSGYNTFSHREMVRAWLNRGR